MNKDNGYWIECVPVRQPSLLTLNPGFYAASVCDFPDLKVYGLSPDRAITKLKRRLEQIRALRATLEEPQNRDLPTPHNSLRPPNRLHIDGWISVYVTVNDDQE